MEIKNISLKGTQGLKEFVWSKDNKNFIMDTIKYINNCFNLFLKTEDSFFTEIKNINLHET